MKDKAVQLDLFVEVNLIKGSTGDRTRVDRNASLSPESSKQESKETHVPSWNFARRKDSKKD